MHTVILKYDKQSIDINAKWVDSFTKGTVSLQLACKPDDELEKWLENKDMATVIVKLSGMEVKYAAINPQYDGDEKIITFNYGLN